MQTSASCAQAATAAVFANAGSTLVGAGRHSAARRGAIRLAGGADGVGTFNQLTGIVPTIVPLQSAFPVDKELTVCDIYHY